MREAIFITGGTGLLALNWAAARRERGAAVTLGLHERVVTLQGVAARRVTLDAVDAILRDLDEVQPQLVVHTAGMTNVEQCEADPALAAFVNVTIAANVANACARRGVGLVHISTDHLFRGDAALVSESEPVAPQNVYAATKDEAERRVLDANPDALVVRTNFYGWGPSYRPSFSDMIIRSLRRGAGVTLFQDVLYTPILVETLSETVHDLVDAKARGIVHVVGDERISKHDFGVKIAKQFQLDAGLITPGLLADHPALVRRPFDMSLSNAHARRLLGRSATGFGGIDAHLARLHQQEQLGLARELQNL